MFFIHKLRCCVHNVLCYSIPGQSINLISWKCIIQRKEREKQANFTLDNRRTSTHSSVQQQQSNTARKWDTSYKSLFMFQLIRFLHDNIHIRRIEKRGIFPYKTYILSLLSIIFLIQKRWKMQAFLLTSHPFGNSLRLSKEVFLSWQFNSQKRKPNLIFNLKRRRKRKEGPRNTIL